MGVKPHGRGGFIGTNDKGQFVPGTKSSSWLGAWLALMIVPLIGLGVAAPSVLSATFGSLVALGGPFVVMAGAGLASLWGLVVLWSSALWGWLKLALTALGGWLAWELALNILEIGVDAMPALSKIKEAWL